MKKLRRITVDALNSGDVLLVNTSWIDVNNNEEWKFVVNKLYPDDKDSDKLYIEAFLQKSDDTEFNRGKFLVSSITIGKQLFGVGLPAKGMSGASKLDKLITGIVTSIELYEHDS